MRGIKIVRVFCICLAGNLLFSCAKYIDDPVPIDPSEIWLGFRQNKDDTIAVANGYVYLSTHHATSASGTSIISNHKLKGDFELKISYSSFIASGSNAFSDQLEFNLSQEGLANPLVAGFLTNDDIYLQDSTRTSISRPTTNRSGKFYVKRMGSSLYTWINAGGDSLFLNKTNYSVADLSIEATVYSWDNSATHTSVHINDILVSGGGGAVQSNNFDQNTIYVVQ